MKRNFLALTSVLSAALAISAGDLFARGGGGGGGGGGTTPTVSCPLPSTAPAPDVILRDSFGLADLFRPTGDKGKCRETYLHTPIQGFWLEYPGSKDTAWIAPSEGQTWRFCASSENPLEMPSPIQVTYGNGCGPPNGSTHPLSISRRL